jgi:hypothetical protein
MRTPHPAVSILLALGCTALTGCPSSSGGGGAGSSAASNAGSGGSAASNAGSGGGDGGAIVDAGTVFDAGSDDAGVVCPDSAPDVNTFLPGMVVMGDSKNIQAKLLMASPNPPEKLNNDWTIEFMDASGNPLTDVALTKVYAFMPYHGHGKPGYSMTQLSDPSQYDVGINLFMRGYFELQFTVSSPTAGDDMVKFYYCVR